VSENLELVRSIFADWERGDFRRTDWAHPEIEFVFADGPEPGRWTGLAATAKAWRNWLSSFDGFRVEPIDYIEIDDERVLVLVDFTGRAKTSGVQLGEMRTKNAALTETQDGSLVSLMLYWDRDRAFADLGLEE
jgi:ketosteroid isomerase-like protein